jgi:hypothetical protein
MEQGVMCRIEADLPAATQHRSKVLDANSHTHKFDNHLAKWGVELDLKSLVALPGIRSQGVSFIQ